MARTKWRTGRRLLAAALSSTVIFASCGSTPPPPASIATSSDAPTSPAASGPTASLGTAGLPPVVVPPPPAAAALPSGTVDQQAAALATAVAPGGQAALAPLLRAYDVAGIPVVGADGKGIGSTGDDPVGANYWQVWVSAGANPKAGIPLSDLAKVLIAMPDALPIDTDAAATDLLGDLRTMSADSDAHRRFFARFVLDRAAARSGGIDPLAASVTPADLLLDPITMQFLYAGIVRELAFALLPHATASAGTDVALQGPMLASVDNTPLGMPTRPGYADAAPEACNPSGLGEQVSFWTQWIVSKAAGGIQIPGLESGVKSLIERVVKSAQAAKTLGTAAAVLSGAVSALLFLLQVTSLTADLRSEPQPLVRTPHTAADGYPGVITAWLHYDLEGSSLDGGQGLKNCLLWVMNFIGIQAALPADGSVPGADLVFKGIQGFGERANTNGSYVQFPHGGSEIRQMTGTGGIATIAIEGIHQKKEIPDGTPEWAREFSIEVEATVEASNGRSIVNTFIDSFVGVGAGPVGLVNPLVDIAKTFRYDLGEQFMPITDWILGWKYADQTPLGLLSGDKCDGLGGEWVIKGDQKLGIIENSTLKNVTIDEKTRTGKFTAEAIQKGGPTLSVRNANGTATISIDSTGMVTMVLKETSATLTGTVNGFTKTIKVTPATSTVYWEPRDSDCPKE